MITFRRVCGVVCFALFFGFWAFLTINGNPQNTLHVSGQSYAVLLCGICLAGLIGIKDLATAIIGKLKDAK